MRVFTILFELYYYYYYVTYIALTNVAVRYSMAGQVIVSL